MNKKDGKTAFFFLLPLISLFLVFFLYPITRTIYLSFTDWMAVSPVRNFIGLTNYKNAFSDSNFLNAIKNTLIWTALYTTISVGMGLLLASLTFRIGRGANLFKSILYYPLVLSFVVIGVLWSWMYDSQVGLINIFFRYIGLGSLTRNWLGDGNTALGAVIVAASWCQIPFCMVIFLAGLTTIPPELIEAANVDGANFFQSFVHVTLPMLRNVSAVAISLTIMRSFKVFDLVYVMTKGGPFRSSEVIAHYMYFIAFKNFSFAYGCTMSILMGIFIFPIALIYIRKLSRAMI